MATWFRSAALFTLLPFALAAAGADKSHQEHKEPWIVKPDPDKVAIFDRPSDPTRAIALRSTHLLFPSYSSRFVALDPKVPGQKMDGDWFQIYNLQNLKAVGPAFPAPVDLGDLRVLSPDGAYLAGRTKGQHSTISIWESSTGKLLRSIEVSDDPKRFAFPADFAGQNQLLTKCHNGLFPLAEAQTLYQLWDVVTGKEIVRFNAGLVWSCKWATVSPGGRYVVMEKTERRSYRLLAWDLTTGQTAGEAEFQGGNEPWGQACGVVFSPDATRLAVVWRLGKPDLWGQVIVFDVVQGKRLGTVPLDYTLKSIGLGLNLKDRPALQWTPNGDSWLILGHLLMDCNTGVAIGRIGREPGSTWEVEPRRFVGPNFLTTIADQQHQQQLTFTGLPKKSS